MSSIYRRSDRGSDLAATGRHTRPGFRLGSLAPFPSLLRFSPFLSPRRLPCASLAHTRTRRHGGRAVTAACIAAIDRASEQLGAVVTITSTPASWRAIAVGRSASHRPMPCIHLAREMKKSSRAATFLAPDLLSKPVEMFPGGRARRAAGRWIADGRTDGTDKANGRKRTDGADFRRRLASS